MVVHTVGHSTLALDVFLALLARHAIDGVIDVRRFPASRRHPHFAREPLRAALAVAGVAYVWLPALGGYRRGHPASPHVGWRSASFRAYADHMDSAEFQDGLEALVRFADRRRAVVLCAEAVPWRCHRQLIADVLITRGVDVRHVTGPRVAEPHRLTPFARTEGDRIVYDRSVPGVLASRSRPDRP